MHFPHRSGTCIPQFLTNSGICRYNHGMSKRLRRIIDELELEVDNALLLRSEDDAARDHYDAVHLGLRIAIEVVEEQLAEWRVARAARANRPSRAQLRERPSVN